MKSKVVSTRIPISLYEKMLECAKDYMHDSDFVRTAIREKIARYGE